MDEEDDDMHICLVCQATVMGLVNYVNHKKYECIGKKNAEKEKKIESPVTCTQQNYAQNETTSQSFMQILSTNGQFSQSQIYCSQMESLSPISTNQQLSQSPPGHMFSMSTSPSHGVQFSTQITFSEEIGPVMSLQQNSDLLSQPVSDINNEKSSNGHISYTSATNQSLTLDVDNQYITMQAENFSPPGIDPSMVTNSRSDFFSSLALQKKGEKNGGNQNEPKDSLTADLPISNILNNLDFYDEDLDFVFSDDDFLQDAFTDESDDDSVPPSNHTHGKWKPGDGPSYHSKVVWQPGKRPMHPSKGKWRPGEMPAKGKLQSHIIAREKEKAKEGEENVNIRRGNRRINEYNCQYCDVKFTNKFLYSNHCTKKEHKVNVTNYRKIKDIVKSLDEPDQISETKTSQIVESRKDKTLEVNKTATTDLKSEETEKEPEKEDQIIENNQVYVCAVCDKKFNNKYIMARHLLSTYHKNRTKGHPDAIKVLEQYHKYIVWLSPYQCTICQFYFNRNQDFMDHLKSDSHLMQCEGLDGEIMCSICKFCCHDNGSLLQHFENDGAHALAAKKGSKPCIIKEKNYDAECKYCKKILHSKLHMKRHMRAQHFKEYSEYESSCKLCNKTFFDSYSYKRHMTTSQHRLRAEQKKKFGHVESEEEPEVFNEGIIRTRINRQGEKPYKLAKKIGKNINKSHKCDYCDFVASQYDELRPHYLEQHANHVFVCELCDLTFITEKARKVHFAGIKHQTNLKKSEGNTTSVIEQCDYCDRRFEDEKLKLFHTEVYHLHPNSEESLREKLGHEDTTTVKYREFLASVDGLKDERVQCLECPKTIMKDYILEHLRSHSGDKPYKCRYCSSGFAAPLSLRRHLMSHVGLADRKCEVCGKEFKKFGSYREHMTKHCLEENKASKLICDICGQSFLLQKQLNIHMKRHGEKKFKCEYPGCRWSFFLYNELKAHHRSHTGERAYLCDICGYSAGTRNRLNRHHRTHTGVRDYHCEYCNYKAGTRTHLRRHMRIHIGSKPYKCPYCAYRCNTHENIRKHISKTKKHAGLPIYPCQFCEYGTSNTIDFRFHLEQKHKGEFNFKASDGLAIIAGLYKKDDDPDKPMEGTEIYQVRERKVRTDRPAKPKQKRKGTQYEHIEYDIPDNKLEMCDQYQENDEAFHPDTTVVVVNASHWPSEYATQPKITPITGDLQTYQHSEESNFSSQISSVGYFMPVSTAPTALTEESGLVPQPPAIQVDVVANSLKYEWQYR